MPNRKYRGREYLLPQEVERLLEAAREHSRYPVRDYALTLLMYRHGLRAVEAAMLRWDDVDLEQRTIYVNRVKGSKPATHPLQSDEVDALSRLDRSGSHSGSHCFTSERGRSFLVSAKLAHQSDRAPGISRIIERLGQASDLDIKVHAHMLRHACGYYLANQGYDTRLIQAWLGHSNIQHTVRYTELSPDRFKGIQFGSFCH